MANFSSILDMPSTEVRFPKLPVGSYVGVVKGMPRFDKSTKKQTPYVEFMISFVEPMADVDPDALEDFGPIADKSLPLTFYYETEGGYNRLKTFLDNCGVEDEGTPRQRIEQVPGRTIVVEVKHVASQDGQSIYAQIDGTAKYGD
jgi:hypothetical protein